MKLPVKPNIVNIIPYKPGVLKAGAIKLASNENPLGTSPLAMQAIANIGSVALYPDGACQQLRAKLAVKYGLDASNFIVGNGSDEIFIFIAGLLINEGDHILTSEVTFSEYAFAAKLFGGSAVTVPMVDNRYHLEVFAENITAKTKVVFIANPNNPTGTYVTQKQVEQFMQKVPQDVLVVMDEAYYEYVQAENFPDVVAMLTKYNNLLITRTFSKLYGLAGLRVGYAIGSVELIDLLNRCREPFNVNSIAQLAAIAALDDFDFLANSIKVNEEGKAYLYGQLAELGLTYLKTEGNFILINLPIAGDVAFKRIMDLGVTVRAMSSFGLMNSIRVTVGTQEQNQLFIKLLKQVLKEQA